MPGPTTKIPVTINRAQADDARQALSDWNGVLAAKIIGETTDELGLYVEVLTSPLSGGAMRDELEQRIKPFGGRIGAKDAWLVEGQKHAKDWL